MPSPLTQRLLDWYKIHARSLPWRDHPDPYAVWVAEIMLQQTRVETVIPYFERWMRRFPTVETLANASQQEVLALWEGLGYYGRARNLHKAACLLVVEKGGELPRDPAALRRLPGIGRYTAAAIASIAFGLDEPALDGNIRRVLSRLFDLRQPVHSTEAETRLRELANGHLPQGRAGEYNQALMDLGAMICTPRQPDCPSCPLRDICLAYSLGVQAERPVPEPKPALPHHTVTAAVIQCNGHVLIAQRAEQGLLGGLWEFPGGKTHPGEDLVACLMREILEELDIEVSVGEHLSVHYHAYSHFRVTLHAFRCSLQQGKPRKLIHADLRWVKPSDLSSYPMGKIDRQIARKIADRS
jgi:A/G-specific adenine glycosylase